MQEFRVSPIPPRPARQPDTPNRAVPFRNDAPRKTNRRHLTLRISEQDLAQIDRFAEEHGPNAYRLHRPHLHR